MNMSTFFNTLLSTGILYGSNLEWHLLNDLFAVDQTFVKDLSSSNEVWPIVAWQIWNSLLI